MTRYILRKLAYGIVVLVGVVLLISSIIYLAPVDPTRLTFGQRADVQTVEAKQKALGLDQPLYVQLSRYLRDVSPIAVVDRSSAFWPNYKKVALLNFDSNSLILKWPYLRESYQQGREVTSMLKEAIPKTLLLATAAMILALIIGVIIGLLAALYADTWIDRLAVSISVLGISLPSYVSAIILALVFGYLLADWTGLDVQGGLTGIDEYGDPKIFWKNLILPAIALGIRPIAIITQLTRSAVLDVLSQEYIRTATAKGLSFRKVIRQHVLRNAFNPVFTAATGWFASLLAGAFFVENVFGYNGLGQMTVQALLTYDIPVVLGAVLFTAATFVVLNLLVDITYGIIDPRIRINE